MSVFFIIFAKMVKIVAIFKGRNSLGYTYGHTYDIDIVQGSFKGGRYPDVRISEIGGNCHPCVYSGMDTFLQNWKIISYRIGYKPINNDYIEKKITQVIRDSKISQLIS